MVEWSYHLPFECRAWCQVFSLPLFCQVSLSFSTWWQLYHLGRFQIYFRQKNQSSKKKSSKLKFRMSSKKKWKFRKKHHFRILGNDFYLFFVLFCVIYSETHPWSVTWKYISSRSAPVADSRFEKKILITLILFFTLYWPQVIFFVCFSLKSLEAYFTGYLAVLSVIFLLFFFLEKS